MFVWKIENQSSQPGNVEKERRKAEKSKKGGEIKW